ncbi:PEP-CTERM sorting domain-containing protein [Nostoc sp. UHCC 0702]|nr:PEP-CTERM sorting domain-containing protein [Nostoc sp. UHCC 0702]
MLNTAQAVIVNVGTSNQGWWSTGAGNDNSNDNYFTGNLGTNSYHSFFTFNLGTLAEVSSATLQIKRYVGEGSSTHTLGFFDVSTSANILSQKSNNPNLDIYNDLGTGKNYGTFDVSTSGNSEEILSFDLNSEAIADINARSGQSFSIGGALLGDLASGDQYLFGYSGGWSTKVVVNANSGSVSNVPEPLTLGGTVVAGGMGWWLKRKRKSAQAV